MKEKSQLVKIESSLKESKRHSSNETYFLATIEEIPAYIDICNELELHEIEELEEGNCSSGTISKN